jgi:D-lactate dehydrogenase (cytochrome)
MLPSPALLNSLRNIVGPQGHLDEAADIAPFTVDHRKLYRGATPLVLRPNTTAQVSEILKLCNEAGVGVVPVGGNTSYCGGATPSEDGSQVVVALGRLKRIRQVDPLNYTLTAEAGCVLAEVQAAAENEDRLFPLSLGSEGSCQIGGNLSTNAGGTAVLRYGMMRDLVLGLEVVLPDGRVFDNLNGLRKDNTGYDVRDLFIGAEGTLGIITAATCKLFPRPRTLVTALVAVENPAAAISLLAHLRAASGDGLATFELIPRIAFELVLQTIAGTSNPFDAPYPWYLLIEATRSRWDEQFKGAIEGALLAAQERNLLLDAAVAQNEDQRRMFWRIRESIPEAQTKIGASIKHDVSVNISSLPEFMSRATAECERVIPGGRVVSYGHLGDGSLHFNVSQPLHADKSEFVAKTPALNRAIHNLVAEFGGSISAEHGIGKLKRDELARYKNPVALEIMRSIKRALDPRGIMNPGKVL